VRAATELDEPERQVELDGDEGCIDVDV